MDVNCSHILNESGITDTISQSTESVTDYLSPLIILKNTKLANVNRLVIAHLNVNSLRNKFESLKLLVKGNIDILVISETKLDESFPTPQFAIEGYSIPFRIDRNDRGGGVLLYVREDLPCKELNRFPTSNSFEGIFIELNLRKTKWLIFGGYNYNKSNIDNYLNTLGLRLDHFMTNYENFLLLGDFNSETHESFMSEFCNIYNLCNLVKEPTCFKNPLNPSSIDLILTNKPKRFQNTFTIETGLSDHHKMTVTVLRSFVQKLAPCCIRYRDYKKFNSVLFSNELTRELYDINIENINYDSFQFIFTRLLNQHAPMKEKFVRANNAPFMNKQLSKAVMTRSRLRNRFLKKNIKENEIKYKKQRNYCVNLSKKIKRQYYNNLDITKVLDNKKFWSAIKPLFSDKHIISKKITLIEGDNIISDDVRVAETFNTYFSSIVANLDIKGYIGDNSLTDSNPIFNAINAYKEHPSIRAIKGEVEIKEPFTFFLIDDETIKVEINNLNINKPTTFNCIPTKILVENKDICAPFLSKIFNESLLCHEFPAALKHAEILPGFKKYETTNKDNYRPISILPASSKIFERVMEIQILAYMSPYLSNYLCAFRKGYSTQYCLLAMLEKWRKALDNRNLAGALLTDLSKAFDCLNHELLIAKLDAYGFNEASLTYIYSYLTGRKHRTKVNNSFSSWANINSGIPQGSIIGPLLFNIYINDIFFFIDKHNLANYADDNTPFAINSKLDTLLTSLETYTSILVLWLEDNYFKMNPDKCHLLVTNHDDDVSITVDREIIVGSKSVKLLGLNIDNKLDFTEHVSKICGKVSQKLHALARISPFMDQKKLRTILKAFIESQFGYCPLVWMHHNRTLNNRINHLHEKALRIIYKDPNLSFEELLVLDNSFTIHHRNIQKLATEMYKVKNDIAPTIMKDIFPIFTKPYYMRKESEFETSNIHSVFNGTETVSFRGPKIWSIIPKEIKDSNTLPEFKAKIKHWRPEGCMCRLCKQYIPNLGFL